MYYKKLPSGYMIQNTQKEHTKALELLQRKVFPKLSEEELFTASMYLKHIEKFPEGQFVILDGKKVIGMTTTIRYKDTGKEHTFLQISGNGNLETHHPEGDYLYGLDVGIDPRYRRKGLAKALYSARQELVHSLGLKGQLIVGMLNGYESYQNLYTIDEYYQKVKNNELSDPTVSMQLKLGFKIIKLIKNYLHDPTCGNAGVLLKLDAATRI
jgi:ribosomal protein S18 acetylase RimI-like enzyme